MDLGHRIKIDQYFPFAISFAHNSAYSDSTGARATLNDVDLERVLVKTDELTQPEAA